MSRELARRLLGAGIRDERVLHAMAEVPRHLFVPEPLRARADDDLPLPIGCGQTISQPYVVAFMTQALGLSGTEKALEVGTGSGYQTAVLALLAREVCSVEIAPELAARAAAVLLGTLGLRNVRLEVADGWEGWPSEAPFDRILVTAAARKVPEALVEQLGPGGRMVVPVGEVEEVQQLTVVEKGSGGSTIAREVLPVRFVPLRRGAPGPE